MKRNDEIVGRKIRVIAQTMPGRLRFMPIRVELVNGSIKERLTSATAKLAPRFSQLHIQVVLMHAENATGSILGEFMLTRFDDMKHEFHAKIVGNFSRLLL